MKNIYYKNFEFPHFLFNTKIILLWRIPNVLPKGSCLGALVLKLRFLWLYAPLRILSKHKWAAGGKTLELPGSHNLCTKKMWKLKYKNILIHLSGLIIINIIKPIFYLFKLPHAALLLSCTDTIILYFTVLQVEIYQIPCLPAISLDYT